MEMDEILRNGYDVVHLHTNYWKSFLAEELAKKHGVPKIIIHAHNTFVSEDEEINRENAVKLHILRKSQFCPELGTDFWACSQMAADWLFGERKLNDKIVIMKNAINLEEFQYKVGVRDEYRKKLDLENSFVIGHVGRFVYQKNHEFLIDVFKEVKSKIDNAKLLLVGVGPLKESIICKIKEYELQDDVIFLGKRDDVGCVLQAMDVFCLPSRFEGLGMVVIEAQATGLKCIASDLVPEDVEITDSVVRLPLNTKVWVENIIKCSDIYDRVNNYQKITDAGYNIDYQIKVIEDYYSPKFN